MRCRKDEQQSGICAGDLTPPVEHDAVSAFIDCNSDLRFIPSDLFRLAGSSDVSARCVVLGDDKGEQTVRRQASVSQLASMRRDRPVEHTADVVGMAAVKIKDAFSHPIRRFIETPDDPTALAVMCEERDIRHLLDATGRPDEGERHLPIWSRRALAGEEIDLISFLRILVRVPRGQHRKAAVQTLRAPPAMRMEPGHLMDAGTAARVPKQITATEWILDLEGVVEKLRKYPAESRERLWVRRSGRSGTNDLCNRGQVETDDAVLENADALFAEQSRGHGPQRGEQKRSRSVRRFPAEISIELRPDRNMQQAIRAEPVAQLINKVPLGPGDLGRRTVADERDLSAGDHEFFDGPGEGVNPARKQD